MSELTSFPINTSLITDLDPITDAQASDADQILFYDASVAVMKRMSRGELSKGKVIPLDNISVFAGLDTDSFDDRQQFHLNSFSPDGESGGGPLLWNPDLPKSLHDGIRHFSPTVPAPADFDNPTDVQNYMDGVGEEWPTADGVFVLTLFSIQSSEFPAVDGAIVLFDGASGNTVKNGPVPSALGSSSITAVSLGEVSYARANADNTITMRSPADHKIDLAINNVDNTSDADKPISDDTQAAFDALTIYVDDADSDLQVQINNRVQSVATIADFRLLTGLVDGQVIYVREYEAGFNDGGGQFVADTSIIDADNGGSVIVTADGVRCSRRSDIYRAESWGAHSSRANNAPYFQAAADAVLRVDGKLGVIYKFTDQVTLTDSFEFNGNKCQVEFGDGHLNLFNLLADVVYIRIKDISNTIIRGVTLGDGCYKNLYSSYADNGDVIGFPTGTAYIAKETRFENCVPNESRIFSAGSKDDYTTFDCIDIRGNSTNYLVRPCLILSSDHDATVFDRLRLSFNVYEDILKCGRGRSFTLRDSVLRQLTENGLFPIAQVDVYEGSEGAEFYGNRFYNTGTHRKQSGGLGATITSARDGVHDNRFYFSGLAGRSDTVYPCYWRGAFGTFHDNQFFMRLDPTFTGTLYGILCDEEVDLVEPFDQVGPSAIKIHDNTFDFIGCGGTRLDAISFVGAVTELQRDVIGNTLYGGTRLVNGTASVLGGNTWHLPLPGAFPLSAYVAYGNDIPDALTANGKTDNALRQFVVPVAGVIPGAYANFCRVTDGVTITEISGGRAGQEMIIWARNAVTITHGTLIRLNGAVNASMPARSFMRLLKVPDGDGFWEEESRSF